MEHHHRVASVESPLPEGPGGLLEDDGRRRGGVVDEGDFVVVLGVDEASDGGSGLGDAGFEVVEEEPIRLAEEPELPVSLDGDDGGGAAAEAPVVDPSEGGVVVGELCFDLGGRYETRGGFVKDLVAFVGNRFGGGDAVGGGGRGGIAFGATAVIRSCFFRRRERSHWICSKRRKRKRRRMG